MRLHSLLTLPAVMLLVLHCSQHQRRSPQPCGDFVHTAVWLLPPDALCAVHHPPGRCQVSFIMQYADIPYEREYFTSPACGYIQTLYIHNSSWEIHAHILINKHTALHMHTSMYLSTDRHLLHARD